MRVKHCLQMRMVCQLRLAVEGVLPFCALAA